MAVNEVALVAAIVDREGMEESRESGEEGEVEESGEEEEPPPDPLAGLCEYERIRLANIQQVVRTHVPPQIAPADPLATLPPQREALFAALDFGSAKEAASPRPSSSASRRGLARAATAK